MGLQRGWLAHGSYSNTLFLGNTGASPANCCLFLKESYIGGSVDMNRVGLATLAKELKLLDNNSS